MKCGSIVFESGGADSRKTPPRTKKLLLNEFAKADSPFAVLKKEMEKWRNGEIEKLRNGEMECWE